jgi:hypothetical protein
MTLLNVLKPVTPAKAGVYNLSKDWIPLRLPVVKIGLYNRPLRVVSLSNHDFYPPLADSPE